MQTVSWMGCGMLNGIQIVWFSTCGVFLYYSVHYFLFNVVHIFKSEFTTVLFSISFQRNLPLITFKCWLATPSIFYLFSTQSLKYLALIWFWFFTLILELILCFFSILFFFLLKTLFLQISPIFFFLSMFMSEVNISLWFYVRFSLHLWFFFIIVLVTYLFP